MEWYRRHRRDLPWRRTADPYAVWVSEIMLQQTRVETVIPYYHRFLERFPDIGALAAAPEQELLAAWAGLGYYSRVRNMQRAARRMVEGGGFPGEYEAIRLLPGIGDYTAAALASIAFGKPYAVLDGNVARVMARVTNDAGDIRAAPVRLRLRRAASEFLDPVEPGTFNQALMELGATLCTPAEPKCLVCPVRTFCEARQQGRERELPVRPRPGERRVERVTLLIVERGGSVLLWRRPDGSARLAGFWELPEAGLLPAAELLESIGEFRHGITNTSYTFRVWRARIARKPRGPVWMRWNELAGIPLSTTARKALALFSKSGRGGPAGSQR
jgi:A/G-specific adenine glycosylase